HVANDIGPGVSGLRHLLGQRRVDRCEREPGGAGLEARGTRRLFGFLALGEGLLAALRHFSHPLDRYREVQLLPVAQLERGDADQPPVGVEQSAAARAAGYRRARLDERLLVVVAATQRRNDAFGETQLEPARRANGIRALPGSQLGHVGERYRRSGEVPHLELAEVTLGVGKLDLGAVGGVAPADHDPGRVAQHLAVGHHLLAADDDAAAERVPPALRVHGVDRENAGRDFLEQLLGGQRVRRRRRERRKQHRRPEKRAFSHIGPLPCSTPDLTGARAARQRRCPYPSGYGSFGLYSLKSGSSSTAIASSTRATMA